MSGFKKGSGFNIQIKSAKDLLAADIVSSDPFVRIYVKYQSKIVNKMKTKVIKSNLSPKWNESFYIVLDDPLPCVEVLFEVHDADVVGEDYLGEVVVNLTPDWKNFGETMKTKLTSSQNKVKAKGTLSFTISYDPPTGSDAVYFKESYQFPHGKKTKCLLGPILLFRGLNPNKKTYNLGIVVVIDGLGGDTPLLSLSPPPHRNCINVKKLLKQGSRSVYCYDFAIDQLDFPKKLIYYFNDKKHVVSIPGRNDAINITATSCNGFHEDETKTKFLEDREEFEMWKIMWEEHNHEDFGGYHVILQGGDQLYADTVWSTVDVLKGFTPGSRKLEELIWTQESEDKAEEYYMNRYIESLKGPYISDCLASIPSVMMWDDHDIFDGWGSYLDSVQACPVYQGLYRVAEKYFCAIQLGCTADCIPTALPGKHRSKTQAMGINKIGILALDLRTERKRDRVVSNETYTCLDQWLASNTTFDHLIVVLSIPIVYNDLSAIEALLKGSGAEIEDDLLDHWRSKEHEDERKMLLKKLFDFANSSSTRITIISGDVHVGAVGVCNHKTYLKKSNAGSINCLITSPIVNAPPPEAAIHFLEWNHSNIEKLDDMKSGLVKFPPDNRVRYIPNRNFISLISNKESAIVAKWFVERARDDRDMLLLIKPFQKGAKPDLTLVEESTASFILNKLKPGQKTKGWFH